MDADGVKSNMEVRSARPNECVQELVICIFSRADKSPFKYPCADATRLSRPFTTGGPSFLSFLRYRELLSKQQKPFSVQAYNRHTMTTTLPGEYQPNKARTLFSG